MSLKYKYKLMVHEEANSPAAEAFRILRTSLQFAQGDEKLKTIMFTSTGPREGKSTVAANIAVMLAGVGKKVIIMDCDLRKPVQHLIFRRKAVGLTHALRDNIDIKDLIQDTGIHNLRIIASGQVPPNPSELLSSKTMQDILDYLKSLADYVIIDAPPVLAVTDACVLAAKVDGVGLVIGAGMVRPEMAQRAKEQLLNVKAHLIGVTLNRIEDEEDAYYYARYKNEQKVAH